MSPAPARRKARRHRLLWLALLLSLPTRAAADDPAPPAPPAPPVIDAGEITVSSTRTPEGALEIPGNVTRIDRKAIEESGASSVPELLRREAGIMVTSLGTTPEGYTVEARGFNNGGGNGCATLVLVDGRRLNEPETGCPDWSFVALEEIDRIEIVRGPASVAYGDNAAGGVIQIFTRRATEDGFRSASHLSTGSYGSQGGSGLVDGRMGGFSARAFYDHADSNGYRDQSGFDGDEMHLGFGVDLDGMGELRLDGGYDSNLRHRPGALNPVEIRQNRRQADPDSLGDFDRARARFLQTTLELRPMEDVTVRVVPYLRRRIDSGQLSGDDGAGGIFDFSTDTNTDQLGLDGQVEVGFDAFERRHTFLAGGELRREDSDVNNLFSSSTFDSATDVRLRRETWGLFLQQDISLLDDVSLLLGVRYDEIHYTGGGHEDDGGVVSEVSVDKDPDVWSPKAALTWRVAEPVSLYASYARGFRSANVVETVSLVGVKPLDPERTESYEVGGKYRDGCFTGNLALYWMNVKDELLFNPFTFENENLDRVRHRGIELSGSVRPLEWLELYASYTFDDVQILDDVRTSIGPPPTFTDPGSMPITPKNRGAAGAIAHLPYGFELGADALWMGSRPLANDLDNDSKSLPSFATYNARVAWRGSRGPFGLVLEAIGRNLTNREYSEFGGEATFGGAPGYFPSPERSYVLGMRLEMHL